MSSRHAGHGNLEFGQQGEFGTRVNELRGDNTYLPGDIRSQDTVVIGRAIPEDFLLLRGSSVYLLHRF